MTKRLIEYDLPLADISEASAKEKNVHVGLPAQFHIWWARRPLAASRATAFAALIDDPGPDAPAPHGKETEFATMREYLMDLIKRMSPWEAVKEINPDAITKARELIRQQYNCAPKVLDPFSGGGSIPLEALRLGCETYANDYNPVAVFIEKATLEWPQKFGIITNRNDLDLILEIKEDTHEAQIALLKESTTGQQVSILSYMVERWANILLKKMYAEIAQFYPTDTGGWIPVGYLWARTIACQNPNCGAEIPLIAQFWLANRQHKRIAYRPVVDKIHKQVNFEIIEDEAIPANKFDPDEGTITRGDARCLVCEQITRAKDIRNLAQLGKMGERLIATILYHPEQPGKRYRLSDSEDRRAYEKAKSYLDEKIKTWPYLESPLPKEQAPPEGHRSCSNAVYGMTTWDKFFNTRQSLSLITLLQLIKASNETIQAECYKLSSQMQIFGITINGAELAVAVTGTLALLHDRTASFCCNLARWASTGEIIKNIYARQAIPMLWDYVESNPCSASTGSYQSQISYMLAYLNQPRPYPGTVAISVDNNSATDLPYQDNFFDAVLTDPPYYDNVHYADLSDFFYVWLKRSVGELFPQMLKWSPMSRPKIAENKNQGPKRGEWHSTGLGGACARRRGCGEWG